MAIRDFIDSLSDEQGIAARMTTDPVLALAGAGSGKTRMLMGRFAHLVSPVDQGGLGADPGSIMMVTFTNKAAREMRSRIAPILEELREQSDRFRGEPWIGTFHGLSLRILRIEASKAGLGSNFSIFDEDDARALVNDVVEEYAIKPFDIDEFFRDLEIAKAYMLEPGFLMHARDKVIAVEESNADRTNFILNCETILHRFKSNQFIDIYEGYQNALHGQNAVDFNDLLNRTTRMMGHSDEVRDSWRSSFRHFMVDEVQDINRAQLAWLEIMTGGGMQVDIPDHEQGSEHGEAADGLHEINTYRLRKFPRPTVAFVGDDDQSIYGFRGSDAAVVRNLERKFPGLAKTFLKTSYRCQPSILEASNKLVAHNTERVGKNLVPVQGSVRYGPVTIWRATTPDQEIRRICEEVKSFMEQGGNPSEFAVLARTRPLARAVARGARTFGLPVVEGKSSDLRKTREIRDVMGFVTCLTNEDAEVPLRRVLNKPARGLGPTSLRKVVENARLKECGFLDELRNIMNDRIDIPEEGVAYGTAFVKNLKSFGKMMVGLRRDIGMADNARAGLMMVLRQTGYLDAQYHDALRSAKLEPCETGVMEMEPREFLQWLIARIDAFGKQPRQGTLLEGEDLVDQAGKSSESARRIGNISLLLEESREFDSLAAFAQDSVLEMGQIQAPAGLQVMTIHAAKGLEFDHVRLPFWIDGLMPHSRALSGNNSGRALEEERRLAYVAITRARSTVEISRPLDIKGCGFIQARYARPSCFLAELETAGPDHVRVLKRDIKGFAYEMAPITRAAPVSDAGTQMEQAQIHVVGNAENMFSGETSGETVSHRFSRARNAPVVESSGFDGFDGYDMDLYMQVPVDNSEQYSRNDSTGLSGRDSGTGQDPYSAGDMSPMDAYEEEMLSQPDSSGAEDENNQVDSENDLVPF